MKLFNVEFESMWPVGGCLIIIAEDEKEADKLAGQTIKHTDKFIVKEVDMSKSGIVIYESGEY